MPGVPEIEVPSARPDSTPAPTAPEPGPNVYFGKAVGGALSEAGEQLHGIGLVEYQRAATATAQEAEASFQQQALKLRDEYRSKHLADATNSHQQYTEALEKVQQQIAKNLPTKSAQALYTSNSLRNMRLVQESMDSHFETQSKARQTQAYSLGLTEKVNSAARYALEEGGIARADATIKTAHDDAIAYATSYGMDAETAEQFATKDASKVADGAMGALLKDRDNPRKAIAGYELWKEKLSREGLDHATPAVSVAQTNKKVAEIWANLPRIDAKGRLNPHGQIDQNSLIEEIDTLPNDEMGMKVADELHKRNVKDKADFADRMAQMHQRVENAGMGLGPNGKFGVPAHDPAWQEYMDLDSIGANALIARADGYLTSAKREGRADLAYTSKQTAGRMISELYESHDIKNMTEEGVRKKMQVDNPSVTDDQIIRAQKLLKTLQAEKQDPVRREIPSVAQTVLASRFYNSPGDVRRYKNQAIEFLDSIYKEGMDRTKMQTALEEQVRKRGWFQSSMPLSDFHPNPSSKPASQIVQSISNDAEFDALKPGTHFRGPDGKEYIK